MATVMTMPSPAVAVAPTLKRKWKFKPDLIETMKISRRAGDLKVECLTTGETSSIAAISAEWCRIRSNSFILPVAQSVTGQVLKPKRKFIPELIETTKRSRRVATRLTPQATFQSLPAELHIEIFSHLDKIDAACLGVTSQRSYGIFKQRYGKVPLNQRRIGPNTLESAWKGAGHQQCKHCGIYRCELHVHLADWVPKDLEYCAVKMIFGAKGAEGARESCYRGVPSKPGRCGRHPLKTVEATAGGA